MNLITDPWIPVLLEDGRKHSCSLSECFADAPGIKDLDVPAHERIALMRLLLCVAQAALDGSFDDIEAGAQDLQRKVADYLSRWQSAFDLFGDGARFLQLAGITGPEADEVPVTKLDLTLATGSASTLFDNAAVTVRQMSPARIALNLLTYQCFSPGGLIGTVNWGGSATSRHSTHAPCVASSALHTFCVGTNLLQTICLNLITKEQISRPIQWGRPIWEKPIESPNDKAAIENATLTYLGRLVACPRAIRLHENCTTVLLGHAIDYPIYPIFRETTVTIVQPDTKKERMVMRAQSGSLWRQLPAVLVRQKAGANLLAGPMALQNLIDRENYTLWMGAFITDQAKPIDLVEGRFQIPATLLAEQGRNAFEAAIHYAETWEKALLAGLRAYTGSLKASETPYAKARRLYWTLADQNIGKLMHLARNPSLGADMAATDWGRAIHAAAFEAYDTLANKATPRQLRAFALGSKTMQARKTNPK